VLTSLLEPDAPACLQDKEGKVAYLNKIIAVVSLVLNEAVPAKPLKVIDAPSAAQPSLRRHHAWMSVHTASPCGRQAPLTALSSGVAGHSVMTAVCMPVLRRPALSSRALLLLLQIVAGLEPEHTNTFLQMLGRAARMGPAADAVQVRFGVLTRQVAGVVTVQRQLHWCC
jgi:hypothetical protein